MSSKIKIFVIFVQIGKEHKQVKKVFRTLKDVFSKRGEIGK